MASTVVRAASSSKPPALGFSCTSLTTTFALSAAQALAMARPKPELAPVTTTTLFWRRAMVVLSGRGESAVDGEQGAGGPAGVGGGEERRRLAHVLRGAQLGPRRLVVQHLVQLGVVEERADHRGGEEAGADGVDVDALRGEVDRQLAGQVDHGALRGAVRGLEREPDQATDGGDVDDPPAGAVDRLLGEHLTDRELAAQPHALAVDGHRAVVLVLGLVHDRVQAGEDAGVVDHHVELPEARHDRGHQTLHRRVVGGVGLDVLGLAAVGPDDVVGRGADVALVAALARLPADVRAHHRRALGGEGERDRAAVARAGSGDHGHLVLQLGPHQRLTPRWVTNQSRAAGPEASKPSTYASKWPPGKICSFFGSRARSYAAMARSVGVSTSFCAGIISSGVGLM